MTVRGGVLLLLLLLLSGLHACAGLPRLVVLHDPLTPEEHVTLGSSYEAQGLRDLAAQEYHAALRRQTEYVPALVGLGNLSFASGALQEAEDYYRQALDVEPKHPGAGNNLAMVYLARGAQLDEAERLATSAAGQDGAVRPYALDTLAQIYIRQGRYREARRTLDEAEAMVSPHNQILRDRLAQSRQELAAASSQRNKEDN